MSRRSLPILLAAALCLTPISSALADDRSDAVDEQNEAQRKQAEPSPSPEGVSADLGQAYIDLQNAQTSLSNAETELKTAETTLKEKEREQKTAADRLTIAQDSLDQITAEASSSQATADETSGSVAQLVVSTYQGDTSVTSLTYVLESGSAEELSSRAETMQIASGVQESVLSAAEAKRAQDANRKARQDAATSRVATLKADADAAATAAQTARDDAKTKRDNVSTLTTQKAKAASDLEARKSDLESQQAQAAKDADAAAAKIAEIDAKNRAAYAAGQTGVSSDSIAADSLGSGYIGHPISGPLTVTSPFGFRIHPVTGVGVGHQGTDFAASEGTPQYAAVSGTATYWDSPSCGIGIDINAGYIDGHSYVITLCHLSGRAIADGQYVNRGDVVGYTGSTGYATGPHVHFQVAQDGVYIDPMTLPGF